MDKQRDTNSKPDGLKVTDMDWLSELDPEERKRVDTFAKRLLDAAVKAGFRPNVE